MTLIKNLIGRQILDSRGNHTIEVDVIINDGLIIEVPITFKNR